MSDPFVGEIKMFAGNFAPRGWAFCNGQLLAITSNETLYSLIEYRYSQARDPAYCPDKLASAVAVKRKH
jgi:microcystin-dependent protein